MNEPAVSVLIVNYNTGPLLKQCVDSIIAKTVTPFEVIVIDNASKDDSLQGVEEIHSSVTIIRSSKNLGFAKANNLGAKRARGEHLLILNPDTIVGPGAIDAMCQLLEQAGTVGALGCRLELSSGAIEPPCKRLLPTPRNALAHVLSKIGISVLGSGYCGAYSDHFGVYPVECLSGSCMMIRKGVFEQISGFDERFFMYGEDIDICQRIQNAGHQIYYLGTHCIVHLRGQSSLAKSPLNGAKKSSGRRRPITVFEFYRSMVLYYRKHQMRTRNLFTNVAVFSGIGLAAMFALLRNEFRRFSGEAA